MLIKSLIEVASLFGGLLVLYIQRHSIGLLQIQNMEFWIRNDLILHNSLIQPEIFIFTSYILFIQSSRCSMSQYKCQVPDVVASSNSR